MMNDYMDYYNHINNLNQIPNSLQTMPNQTNNQVQNGSVKAPKKYQTKTNTSIAEPYEGFVQGNMFNNLYYGYKNYRPQELNPQNDKEYLQLLVQMYGFAGHDLGLYLDVNPNDVNILNKRNEYIRMYNEALAQYENNFGPLTQNSIVPNSNSWFWEDTKWPWEGMK